jgi:hypothetical protein
LERQPGEERILWIAFGIALAFATFVEWVMLAAPIPPGGDEGQWLATAYVYVGIPYPSQIIPFGYPFASFLPLGLLVRVTNDPLIATRLFVGLLVTSIGFTGYVLARALFHRAWIALVAEVAILLQPDFERLYFFGSYPTLFGFIFFFVAVAFAVRFARSGTGTYAFVFWVAFALSILSESLDGVVLAGVLGLLGFFLLLRRRLPRELFTSRASALGFGVFVLLVGGFYLGTRLAHIPHPNYLQAGALAATDVLPALVSPFHIEDVASLFHRGFPMTIETSLEILVALAFVLFLALFVVTLWKTRYFNTAGIAIGSWLLSPILVGLVAWELSIVTDFRRYAYFLYPAIILALILIVDLAIDRYTRALRDRAAQAIVRRGAVSPESPVGSIAGVAVSPNRVGGPQTGVVVVAAVILLALTAVAGTYPAAQKYEGQFTLYGHNQDFLNLMNGIRGSAVPGGVITYQVVDAKWIRALTGRNSFEPSGPGGFVFTTSQLLDDELAYYALSSRYAVTNQLVSAQIAGTVPGVLNATPDVGAYIYGTPVATVRIPPQYLYVNLTPGASTPVYVPGKTSLTVLGPPTTAASAFELVFRDPSFTVVETVTAVPNTATVSVALQAQALGTALLYGVGANLTSPVAGRNASISDSPGSSSFLWATYAYGGKTNTTGTVSPVGSVLELGGRSPRAPAGAGGHYLWVRSNPSAAATGAKSLGLTISLTTAHASNVINDLPTFISTPAIWQMWDTHLVVLDDIVDPGIGLTTWQYLHAEYGAQVYLQYGVTAAILLPPPSSVGPG